MASTTTRTSSGWATSGGSELRRARSLPALLLAALPLALPVAAPAASGRLEVRLSDQKDRPVDLGVVVAKPVAGSAAVPRPDGIEIMDQVDEAFVPHVLAVPVGATVSFPNQDDIRHHVYSFSDAKKFELPLYKGTPAEPVVFDQPGEVVLGCNIHDHMRGYIYVVNSPYYATVSEDGTAVIDALPAGDYEITVWHPGLKREPEPATVHVVADAAAALDLGLELKPALRLRGSAARGKKY